MFWIQETGNNKNNSNYRLFYADYEDDIFKLPTAQYEGTQENGDSVANHKCAAGSKCFVIENSKSYVLSKETDKWKEIKTVCSNLDDFINDRIAESNEELLGGAS